MRADIAVFAMALLALFPIINPIGAVASFAGLTADFTRKELRTQAWHTSVYVFGILAAFTVLGSFILDMFRLELPAIQIAGGFVVAHSGYRMLVPSPATHDHDGGSDVDEVDDIAFTPMALPLIAGPGAIGEVIGLSARYTEPRERLAILIAVLVISLVIMLLLRWCTPLVRKLGPNGILGLTRIMGFIILCIGVELMIHGVSTLMSGM